MAIKYYTCPTCGAVGNWKEFIDSGYCHNPKALEKKMRQDFARSGGRAKYRGKTKEERRKMTESMRKALARKHKSKHKKSKKLSTANV